MLQISLFIEIWYDISNQQLVKLKQVDEMFLQQVFNLAGAEPRKGIHD